MVTADGGEFCCNCNSSIVICGSWPVSILSSWWLFSDALFHCQNVLQSIHQPPSPCSPSSTKQFFTLASAAYLPGSSIVAAAVTSSFFPPSMAVSLWFLGVCALALSYVDPSSQGERHSTEIAPWWGTEAVPTWWIIGPAWAGLGESQDSLTWNTVKSLMVV